MILTGPSPTTVVVRLVGIGIRGRPCKMSSMVIVGLMRGTIRCSASAVLDVIRLLLASTTNQFNRGVLSKIIVC